MYTYRASVDRVVDGDTIDLSWWDLGAGTWLFPTKVNPLRLRLAGINAFETVLRGDTTPAQKQLGLEAKAWLAAQIGGSVVRIRTVKSGDLGSFSRWLVWVWPDGPDDEVLTKATSLNQQIIDRNWGVPYGI